MNVCSADSSGVFDVEMCLANSSGVVDVEARSTITLVGPYTNIEVESTSCTSDFAVVLPRQRH